MIGRSLLTGRQFGLGGQGSRRGDSIGAGIGLDDHRRAGRIDMEVRSESRRTFPSDFPKINLACKSDPYSDWDLSDPIRGRGRGPLEIAASSASLAARIESQLAEEASGPVGSVIPVPSAANTDDLATDLKGLRGQLALVDTTSAGWGEGSQAAPGAGQGSDWRGPAPWPKSTGYRPDSPYGGSGAATSGGGSSGRSTWRCGRVLTLREAVRVMLHSDARLRSGGSS